MGLKESLRGVLIRTGVSLGLLYVILILLKIIDITFPLRYSILFYLSVVFIFTGFILALSMKDFNAYVAYVYGKISSTIPVLQKYTWIVVKVDWYAFVKKWSKYVFLLFLFLVALSGLSFLGSISEFLASHSLLLSVFAIIFGVITFWTNREVVEEVEEEASSEVVEEQRRADEFDSKFKRLAWFNFSYGISEAKGNWFLFFARIVLSPFIWLMRLPYSFVKWMYKEGWVYSIGLILIVLIGFFIFSYNLGEHEFREDEFQVVDAATGYLYTGEFYKWNWLENKSGKDTDCIEKDKFCKYDRAWIHTWLVSKSFKIFGISEWSARIISVIFGLFLLIIIYFFSKKFFGNKSLSIIISLLFALNPNYIVFFRYTRMYALLIPAFLLMIYFLYKVIEEKKKDLKYWVILIILIYINSKIHINSLFIIQSVIIFLFFNNLLLKKYYKYLMWVIIGVIPILMILILKQLNIFTNYINLITFFEKQNYIYLDYLMRYPFPKFINIFFILIIAYFILAHRNKKLIYLYSIILFSLVFLIWIANRYAGFTYISHITTISILLITYGYFILIKIYKNKIFKIFLISLLILIVANNFYLNFDIIYENDTKYGEFSKAYEIIIDKYNYKNEVIFGQYLRNYYLKDLGGNIKYISMLNNKKYTYEQFLIDINKSNKGWITWETRKSYHLNRDIIKYISDNFKQYQGYGVDDTFVEVWYFNESMIN
ncbi:MAG: ArnT family glycosyltransferase [Nanoarchaeota archaeon]